MGKRMRNWKSLGLDLRQQFEILGVLGSDHGKVAAVEGADAADIEAFRQRGQAAVHEIQFGIMVAIHQGDRTRKIHEGQRHELRRLRDSAGSENRTVAAVPPSLLEVVDRLDEDDIRDEQSCFVGRCERFCLVHPTLPLPPRVVASRG